MLILKDNSRSSLNPNHIDYRTKNLQKNISTDSTPLVENSHDPCGKKESTRCQSWTEKVSTSKVSFCRPRLSLLLLSLATPMLCLLTPRHGPIFAGLRFLSEEFFEVSDEHRHS